MTWTFLCRTLKESVVWSFDKDMIIWSTYVQSRNLIKFFTVKESLIRISQSRLRRGGGVEMFGHQGFWSRYDHLQSRSLSKIWSPGKASNQNLSVEVEKRWWGRDVWLVLGHQQGGDPPGEGSNWSRLVQVGHDWSRLVKTGHYSQDLSGYNNFWLVQIS